MQLRFAPPIVTVLYDISILHILTKMWIVSGTFCIACIRLVSLSMCHLCLCVVLHQGCEPVCGCGADVCRPRVGFCFFSLTCLRLHREVRLSLQYAVHQPGTVAIGGVISICSCHLHH